MFLLICLNRVALAPVLACIYRDMRVLHNAMVKPVELGSGIGLKFTIWHYDLVQMWVWERFVELRPKPNVIERGDPRSERWNGVAKFEVSRFVKLLEAFRHLKLVIIYMIILAILSSHH